MPPIRSDSKAPWSPERKDNAKSLGLAVLAHILLIVILFFGLNWHAQNPGPVQVELWMDGDTPNAVPPQPTPEPEPEPPKPEPEPAPPPTPPQTQPKPQPDPQIALEEARKKREQEEKAHQAAKAAREKARLEEERRQAELKEKRHLEQERKAAEKKAKEEADRKSREDAARKVAAEKAATDQKTKEAAARKTAVEKKTKEETAKKAATDKALRDAFRNDILRTAGMSGGTADRNQAGGDRDDGYGAKVRACVQPGVSYPAPPRSGSANPTAEYRVQLGSDGRVGNVTLTRSSGNSGFDRAVETGIRRCNPFPKPSTGRYEPLIDVVYRMYD